MAPEDTVADAVMWVLFGKDSAGATTFDIRPKDANGTDIDFIDIKAELVMDVEARSSLVTETELGKEVEPRSRPFRATNLYEINTIPKSEKEFKAYIEDWYPKR